MLEAAAGAAGGELSLVGVTVLTSHDPAGYARALGRNEADIPGEAERLALVAAEAGLRAWSAPPRKYLSCGGGWGTELRFVVRGSGAGRTPA